MTKETGGPAFPTQPQQTWDGDREIQIGERPGKPGMTLRDYFAAKAMLLAAKKWDEWHKSKKAKRDGAEEDWMQDENTVACVASDAYMIADAMLEARSK